MTANPSFPARARRPADDDTSRGPAWVARLEAVSDRPDAQGKIREAVRRGTLRAVPDPDDPARVRLMRVAPREGDGGAQRPVPDAGAGRAADADLSAR